MTALVVIGVHTPEFAFEHDIDGVRRATEERAIDYPVAVDNDYEIWTAFANHYWPALYFVDRTASSATSTSAKGATSNRSASSSVCSASSASSSPSKGSAWRRRPTGTTFRRPRRISATGAASASRHPTAPRLTNAAPTSSPARLNHWALAGEWTIGRENVVLGQAGGSIAYRFHARDAHLVLSPGAREPIPFRVLLDGEPPGTSHGVDVDEDGNGLLRDGRMYQLVRQHDAVRERTLEITFLESGAEAYAFTFG